ncbi:hypothetical protein [Mycoplasma bradburyae]|nr:hypothetical protein [Mycoplasma bradburyae]UTS70424.1 hypothetical protein NMG68_01655 [Mycoplasma bradburyae]
MISSGFLSFSSLLVFSRFINESSNLGLLSSLAIASCLKLLSPWSSLVSSDLDLSYSLVFSW